LLSRYAVRERTSASRWECQIQKRGNDRSGASNMVHRFIAVILIATGLLGSTIIAATGTSSADRIAVASLSR
jgi:hypothetical protein